MKKLLLIKYGELTTKKGNRKIFIKLLVNNINSILRGIDYTIRYDRVRMYIESDNIDIIIDKLKTVFGIHSIVECYQVNNNMEDIATSLVDFLKNIDDFYNDVVLFGDSLQSRCAILKTRNSRLILPNMDYPAIPFPVLRPIRTDTYG